MRIERDLGFASPHRLSKWSEPARRAGSIIQAEQLLPKSAADPAPTFRPILST
jgi:hypothetical protein